MDVSGQDKDGLRRLLKKRRLELADGEEGGRRCRLMQERLVESGFWKRCRRLALYASVRGEADTSLLLREAWKSGRTVFLPRCRPGEPGYMDLIACRSTEELKLSRFGIPEPVLVEGARLLSAEELVAGEDTLVVVPALAFDRQGFRLGYGGGYYDRLLDRANCCCVGLAFQELLFDRLPHEAWDRPVQAVCTEEELLCL